MTVKPLSSILIKPAGPDCNLACRYCFYLKKSEMFSELKTHRMSDDVLKETVKQMMRDGEQQVAFGWQGGEPTLMGRKFFESAVQYQQKFGRPGQSVGNGLQTNGILIDQDWALFLRDTNFLVGLSLDGPQHIHDKYRNFPSGKSSWERVAKARDIMLDHDVQVNALVVVNDYSVNYAREIYQYHKNSGLVFMQFIPCVEPDMDDPSQAMDFSVSAEGFGRFLCELFDLWLADFRYGQPTTSIRWFDSVFYSYVDMAAPECTLTQECGIYVVVEHNGDVYSCDFFVDPKWHLGNVMDSSLTDMLNSPLQTTFGQVKSSLPNECVECKWLKHCRGGCPKDRLADQRDKGSNHFCQSYKMFFEHADERLKRIAENWKKEHGIIPKQEEKDKEGDSTVYHNVDRNDPCPCGSGKKYKKCCGRNS